MVREPCHAGLHGRKALQAAYLKARRHLFYEPMMFLFGGGSGRIR